MKHEGKTAQLTFLKDIGPQKGTGKGFRGSRGGEE